MTFPDNHERSSLSLVAALLFAACNSQPAQSPKHDSQYLESLHNICHVDDLAQLDADESPISIESDRHEWLMNHVKHPDLIELITLMRVESNPKRATMLESAAEGTPESSCPLARYYRENSD